MKISLLTLGCKVNQAEISELESSLIGKGHHMVGLRDNPDVCVINTCTVTGKSDYQSRQLIRRASRTGARVIVTGCYSELNAATVKAMEGVNAVIGNNEKHIINYILDGISKETTLNNSGHPKPINTSSSRSRHFLKIQDGCSRACTYCIIPSARGKPRSVSPENVVLSVKNAFSEGFNEIVLTGIHLGLYGIDIGSSLSEVLDRILSETDIKRLRLSSLEINEIDDKLLEIIKNARICRHLHIPLQSGDDGILKMMGRPYDKSMFSRGIYRINPEIEGLSIGTDVIVGFPGEDDRAFDNTLNLLKELPISYFHVFPYSSRPGTVASGMAQGAALKVIKERVSLLRALSEAKREHFMKSNIGKTLEVLIETRVSENQYLGTSSNYLKVRASAGHLERGTIVPVEITSIDSGALLGNQVKEL